MQGQALPFKQLCFGARRRAAHLVPSHSARQARAAPAGAGTSQGIISHQPLTALLLSRDAPLASTELHIITLHCSYLASVAHMQT